MVGRLWTSSAANREIVDVRARLGRGGKGLCERLKESPGGAKKSFECSQSATCFRSCCEEDDSKYIHRSADQSVSTHLPHNELHRVQRASGPQLQRGTSPAIKVDEGTRKASLRAGKELPITTSIKYQSACALGGTLRPECCVLRVKDNQCQEEGSPC